MRAVLTATVLATVALFGAGCTGKAQRASDPAAAPAQSGVATAAQSPVDPKIQQACADALKVINESTTAMTDQVDKAVAAGDSGDSAAQTAEIAKIRTTFKDWSAALRNQAGKAQDPKMRSVLSQYAGAVDATIGNIKGPDDLEKLYTFDDTELDQVANSLGQLCGT